MNIRDDKERLIRVLKEALMAQRRTKHIFGYYASGLCYELLSHYDREAGMYLVNWIDKMLSGYSMLEYYVNAKCGTKHEYPTLDRGPWVEWMIKEIERT